MTWLAKIQCGIMCLVMALAMQCRTCGCAEQENDLMQTVVSRYRQLLLEGPKPSAEQIRLLLREQLPDGTWPDINYNDRNRAGWSPAHHMEYLRALAMAWSSSDHEGREDTELRSAINRALDLWAAKRCQSRNWWYNEIGVPRLIRDTIILLGPDLDNARRECALDVLAQYRLRGTAANLMWSAELAIHHGCLTRSDVEVTSAVQRLWNEVRVGANEGIQSDWSFYQHGPKLQAFQYGRSYLDVVTKIAWQLRDTAWQIPPQKRDIITNYMVEGLQWMCRGLYTVPGTIDRSVSRKGALGGADLRGCLRLWREVHPERQAELDRFLARQDGRAAPLVGFRYFPRGDFTAFQRPGFSAFLKTVSSRTAMTESINSENLKGVPYLNCGNLNVLVDGSEYLEMPPVWDWSRLPGLTMAEGLKTQVKTDFVGGIGNGRDGFTAMDYQRTSEKGDATLRARKLWAFHDSAIVCLIGGIVGTGIERPVVTSVEQCRQDGAVSVMRADGTRATLTDTAPESFPGAQWFLHRGIGYVPLGGAEPAVKCGRVAGSWHDINLQYQDVPTTLPVFELVLEHDADLTSSAYAILPGANDQQLNKVLQSSPWRILRNDAQCQCLRFDDGLHMAAFYEGNATGDDATLRVDHPCLAMWTHDRLWLSDPTQQGGKITVSWNGQTRTVQLPPGGIAHEFN